MTLATIDAGGEDASFDASSVAALLERLHRWQSRCTCDTTPVTECPNYLDGDELLFNGSDKMRVKKGDGTWEDLGPGGNDQLGGPRTVIEDLLIDRDPEDDDDEEDPDATT